MMWSDAWCEAIWSSLISLNLVILSVCLGCTNGFIKKFIIFWNSKVVLVATNKDIADYFLSLLPSVW